MRCFNHPERDAVGMCSQCSKATCRECVEDVGAELLCTSCMGLRLRDMRQADAELKADQGRLIEQARQRIRRARLIFVGASILGIIVGTLGVLTEALQSKSPDAPSLGAALILGPIGGVFFGYLIWSVYWGIPAAWKWWRDLFRRVGFFVIFGSPLFLLMATVFFFYIPLIGGYLYGVFGGAFYEQAKCKRIAMGIV
jgi:predicted nucleic acid-binding Zn ribbon protein